MALNSKVIDQFEPFVLNKSVTFMGAIYHMYGSEDLINISGTCTSIWPPIVYLGHDIKHHQKGEIPYV